jgi:ADP-ribose pyrophosphatase YjhB (NUDIX family)
MKVTTLCFLIRENKIFLSIKKEGFGVGFLNGYGGKNKPSESIEEGAVREIEEECGVRVKVKDLEKVAVIDFYKSREHLFQCHVYFAHEWVGEFRESEEMAYPESFLVGDIPYVRMYPPDITWLSRLLAGERIRGKVFHTTDFQLEKFECEPL